MRVLATLSLVVVSVFSQVSFSSQDLPIFDNNPQKTIYNGVDITPEAPALSDFDRRVLALCGPLGGWVDRQAFDRFVFQENQNVFQQMYREVQGLRAQAPVSSEQLRAFQEEFARLWWEAQGFKHVFCGELSDGRRGGMQLGGLHFVGRYIQLAESGQLRQLHPTKCAPETQEGLVYTLGVSFALPNGGVGSKCKNGYGYRMDAYTYFVQAFKAYQILKTAKTVAAACRYRIDSEEGSYWTVLVKRGSAIRTFFTVKLNDRTCQRNTTVCDPEQGVIEQPAERCM